MPRHLKPPREGTLVFGQRNCGPANVDGVPISFSSFFSLLGSQEIVWQSRAMKTSAFYPEYQEEGASGDHVRRELKKVLSEWGHLLPSCVYMILITGFGLHRPPPRSQADCWVALHTSQISKRLWGPNWPWNHSHRRWIGISSLNLTACWLSSACESRAEQNHPHSPLNFKQDPESYRIMFIVYRRQWKVVLNMKNRENLNSSEGKRQSKMPTLRWYNYQVNISKNAL